MKFYLVYLLTTNKDQKVIIKGKYESYEKAAENLLSIALDYVKCDGGERQSKMALQNEKTNEEILAIKELGNGLYLREKENDVIEIYEKCIKTAEGYFYNSTEQIIVEYGVFGITEIDIDIPENGYTCGCNLKNRTTTLKKSGAPLIFLDELSELLKRGEQNFGLKPIL